MGRVRGVVGGDEMKRRRRGSVRKVIFEQREEWPQLLTFVNRNNTAHDNYILKLHRTFDSITFIP